MTSTIDHLEQGGLFDIPDGAHVPHPEDPASGLSADRRRTLRRLKLLAEGYHPVAKVPLHEGAAPVHDRAAEGRRCGTCIFHSSMLHHSKSWLKCLHPEGRGADEVDRKGYPRVTHGAGTDVPAWFPACRDHSYGDPKLSDDAARYVPEAAAR